MKTHNYTVAVGLNGHREVLAGAWMPEKQGLESHGSLFLELTAEKPDWAEKLETVEIEYEEDGIDDDSAMYMNPATGSVDTLGGWHPYTIDNGLIKVEKSKDGSWVEADA